MLHVFLEASGWFFWIIVAALTLLTCKLSSSEGEELGALGFAMIGMGCIILFTDAFAGVRLLALLIGVGLYFAIGIGWSFVKWCEFFVEDVKRAKALYLKSQSVPGETFESYMDGYGGRWPSAANNKRRIVNWMLLWPFSLLWSLLKLPRRFCVWVYGRLSTVYDSAARAVFNRSIK